MENACAKNYRGVMCDDTEEWWKIWKKIDLWGQKWHEEFDEFWALNLKISNICTLVLIFTKAYNENNRGVMVGGTEDVHI